MAELSWLGNLWDEITGRSKKPGIQPEGLLSGTITPEYTPLASEIGLLARNIREVDLPVMGEHLKRNIPAVVASVPGAAVDIFNLPTAAREYAVRSFRGEPTDQVEFFPASTESYDLARQGIIDLLGEAPAFPNVQTQAATTAAEMLTPIPVTAGPRAIQATRNVANRAAEAVERSPLGQGILGLQEQRGLPSMAVPKQSMEDYAEALFRNAIEFTDSSQSKNNVASGLVREMAGQGWWKGVCHKGACDALKKRGLQEGDQFVFLQSAKATGNDIPHTILVDKNNNIIEGGDAAQGVLTGDKWQRGDVTLDVGERIPAAAVVRAAEKYNEYSQPQGLLGSAPENPLIVQHNISPQGVELASDIGGIPMPSLAISRADYPMQGFGEISLLGDPSMAKPSAKNPVYSSDAYSGRQPRAERFVASKKQLMDAIKNDPELKGIPDWESLVKYAEDQAGYGQTAADIFDESLRTIRAGIRKGFDPENLGAIGFYKKLRDGMLPYAERRGQGMPGLLDMGVETKWMMQPEDPFTPMGNRRAPKEYTLEEAMKRMRKQRSSEAATENFAGPGAMRAVLADKFKNIKEVKASRDRIIPREDFVSRKDEFSDEYLKAFNLAREAAPQLSWSGTDEFLIDLASGKSIAWAGDIAPETMQALRSEISRLKGIVDDLPTHYFEIKPKEVYTLGDFKGALVPEEDADSIKRLKDAGIKKIYTYKNSEEKQKLFKKFPELMFSIAGALVLADQQDNEQNQPKYNGVLGF